jgi:hypothetical protein
MKAFYTPSRVGLAAVAVCLFFASTATAFEVAIQSRAPATILSATHLLHSPVEASSSCAAYDPLFMIDFNMVKSREHRGSLSRLAQRLDDECAATEFLVTGHVNPSLYHPDFYYQDADVALESLEDYARSVHALFDQAVSRAEIVTTTVRTQDTPQTITCLWRCSGKANLLWGVDIKAFHITTHWEICPTTGLICRQEDEYGLPQWDLLLSAVFPFLNGVVTAAPAPPVERAPPTMSPWDAWVRKAGGFSSYFASPVEEVAGTHAVEAAVPRKSHNPMDELVVLLEDKKKSILDWKPPLTIDTTATSVVTTSADLEEQQEEEALPTIRSPTLWDRIQAFTPDDAALVNNLHEAARRTETRRSRRYYYAVTTDPEDEDQQGQEQAAAAAAADSSMVI